MNTVNLFAFVVPNKIGEFSSLYFKDEAAKRAADWGFEVTPDDTAIQVWIGERNTDSNSNWTDHGIPEEYRNLFTNKFAPTFLPASMLVNKKEKDSVSLVKGDVKFNITFLQKPYRYGRFGSFEEVVRDMIA